MDTLISNVTVVTMNESMDVIFGGFMGIEKGKISYLAKKAPADQPEKIIDGTGMVLMPGLHNCHAHLAGSLFRGYADGWNEEQLQWRQKAETKFDERTVKAASLLTIAEALRLGTTCISDHYFFTGAVAEAAAESGIKANLCRAATLPEAEEEDFDVENDPGCAELVRLRETRHGYDGGRVKIDAGFRSPATSNYHLWEAMGTYAASEGLGLQYHLTESPKEREEILDRTGLTPAELMDCHHALGKNTCLTGLYGAGAEELSLIGRRKASAVLCPSAEPNLGLASPDLLTLAKAGINVALGSGCPSQGSMDLFEAMALLRRDARRVTGDSQAVPAAAALMTATVCGARAQGREKECGMVKTGMDADLILVDFTSPRLMPCHNVLTCLADTARGSDVVMTMVRGQVLYAAGKYTTIDLDAVVRELAEYAMPRVFGADKGESQD